ncbi:hypothetical protein B0O80DRAFT_432219 [Mortierella sp. GBAus27b]|nr:hypothetical protein B0O80DRAFT_432219 [Mortierella sp. GBAus27b]
MRRRGTEIGKTIQTAGFLAPLNAFVILDTGGSLMTWMPVSQVSVVLVVFHVAAAVAHRDRHGRRVCPILSRSGNASPGFPSSISLVEWDELARPPI